jgi:hypothetical protein
MASPPPLRLCGLSPVSSLLAKPALGHIFRATHAKGAIDPAGLSPGGLHRDCGGRMGLNEEPLSYQGDGEPAPVAILAL